jgi:hypothetical protein
MTNTVLSCLDHLESWNIPVIAGHQKPVQFYTTDQMPGDPNAQPHNKKMFQDFCDKMKGLIGQFCSSLDYTTALEVLNISAQSPKRLFFFEFVLKKKKKTILID